MTGRGARLARVGAVAVLLVASVACDPEPEPTSPSPPDSSPSPVDATPTAGGAITFGVFGEPETLDPYSPVASDLTWALARPVYRSLYRFDPDGKPVADLVASLKTSAELATVTIVDAKWSNGTPITAADVAATIGRARPPSGLAEIDSARVRGPRKLALAGDVVDWAETLARISFVLPKSGRDLYSGPFKIASRVPGLQLVMVPNAAGGPASLERVTVQYTEGTEMLLALLDRERLDAAWLPSSLNLDQRLDELEISHQEALGWERIVLDLEGAVLSKERRARVAAAMNRSAMAEGLVRSDGRVSDTLAPRPGPGGADGPFGRFFGGRSGGDDVTLQIAVPSGDELLELLQRMMQVQLESSGFEVELVSVDARRFYGEWANEDPMDAAVRRLSGAPKWPTSRPSALAALPLFQVENVFAQTIELGGVEINPTVEGPFANLNEWYLAP